MFTPWWHHYHLHFNINCRIMKTFFRDYFFVLQLIFAIYINIFLFLSSSVIWFLIHILIWKRNSYVDAPLSMRSICGVSVVNVLLSHNLFLSRCSPKSPSPSEHTSAVLSASEWHSWVSNQFLSFVKIKIWCKNSCFGLLLVDSIFEMYLWFKNHWYRASD